MKTILTMKDLLSINDYIEFLIELTLELIAISSNNIDKDTDYVLDRADLGFEWLERQERKFYYLTINKLNKYFTNKESKDKVNEIIDKIAKRWGF